LLAAVVLLAVLGGPTAAAAAPGHRLFTITDSRITEASGIAVGLASPGVVYVQNDSGDSSRFFALDARTGATAATFAVPAARNVDWEDIAVARDAAGTPSVWLADIGDNDAARSEVQVYRVDEPHVAASARDGTLRSARPDVWRLRYPGGAVNAESFAVTPDGTGYLVTKSVIGASVVYRLPPRPDASRVQTLQRVGAIQFVPDGTSNPFGIAGELSATAASISRDGSVLVVRTYTAAYVWRLRGADVRAAIAQRATRVRLPEQRQGEGIAVDGPRLLVDSEGVGTAVYAVPVPRVPGSSAPSRSSTASSASRPDRPGPGSAPANARTPPVGGTSHLARWLIGTGAAAAVIVAIAVVRSRRRPSR
jgi:hypothetical protein